MFASHIKFIFLSLASFQTIKHFSLLIAPHADSLLVAENSSGISLRRSIDDEHSDDIPPCPISLSRVCARGALNKSIVPIRHPGRIASWRSRSCCSKAFRFCAQISPFKRQKIMHPSGLRFNGTFQFSSRRRRRRSPLITGRRRRYHGRAGKGSRLVERHESGKSYCFTLISISV